MCSGNLQKAPLSSLFFCCTWKTSLLLVYAMTGFFSSTEQLHLGNTQYNSARTYPSIFCQIPHSKTNAPGF